MAALPPDGVTVALLTPMRAGGNLAGPALDRMVARVVAAGAAGLSPTGSTGEGVRLSRFQRRVVAARVVAAAGGLPVVAGVPVGAVADTLEDIAAVADAGADAALVAPPGYYPLRDDEVVELFTALAERSPLPLVLYHIPSLARVGFSVAAAAALARHHNIVGMKDSGRDIDYLYEVVRATADVDFRVATGTDALLPESVAGGAVGAILASANVAPDNAVALYRAAVNGDTATAARLRDAAATLVAACREAGVPTGWKAAASLQGLCDPHPVPPGLPPDSAQLARLRTALEELDLLGSATS